MLKESLKDKIENIYKDDFTKIITSNDDISTVPTLEGANYKTGI